MLGGLVSIPIRLAVPGLGHTMSCFMIEKYKMLLYCSCLGGGGRLLLLLLLGHAKLNSYHVTLLKGKYTMEMTTPSLK